jgi:PilZ domain-containing protein
MERLLSDVIPFMTCSHEFSWPRRASNGDSYYQVCLRCGAEYGYDWNTMRRTERVASHTAVQNRAHLNRQSGWRPRARRLAVQLDLQFRTAKSAEWTESQVRNVSRSGVLFDADAPIAAKTSVELIFEMPEEISGQPGSKVLCKGRVARCLPPHGSNPKHAVAVHITGYEFLHERREPRNGDPRA